MFTLSIIGMAPLASSAGEAARTSNDDAPPPGYKSMDAVKLAILSGQLKLISPRIDVPTNVELRKGVEYGKSGEQALKLDLYLPKRKKTSKQIGRPVPGLIFIHGGAWKGGRRSDYHYYGVKFAEQGYVVATISYRLLPDWPFPAAIQDAKCAVRWMRANAKQLHVKANRIGVVGGSAGGHLAMLVGYSSDVPELEGNGGHADISSRVQAVVNLYGPTDLTTDFATSNRTLIDFMGGKTIDDVREQYELASPITHVTKDDPPTLIFHGTIDDTVPIAQADLLAKKLRTTGVPCRYDRLKGWPHTMDLAEVVNRRVRRQMIDFFNKHLPLPE
jgi:acetyl esterase/lipase